ncbi:MAG: hypothetical protein B1H06_04350, partial [Candidatus Cloacimonas sp. 4484_143]
MSGYMDNVSYRFFPVNDTVWVNVTLSNGGGPPPGDSGGENISVNITVSGIVYQEFTPEIPVPNANVSAFITTNSSAILNYSITDEEGYFEMVVQIEGDEWEIPGIDIQLNVEADGYYLSNDFAPQNNVGHLIQDMNCVWDVEEIYIEKIWNTTAMLLGRVINETGSPIDGASIFAEGSDYYFNVTESNATGNFTMMVINGDLEICVQKEGYFINCTDYYIEGAVSDPPLVFYLEEIPESTAWINGSVTSDGDALRYVEVMLIDPLHPDQGMKEEMPMTDGSGFFNISTYPGAFKLGTVARLVGKQMDAPPIGIGGYYNEIVDVTVNDGETKIKNISLTEAPPDNVSISISLTNWSGGTVAMSRTVSANAKVLRALIDEDISGDISEDELDSLSDAINESLGGLEHFEEEFIFAGIPFEVCVDDTRLCLIQQTVEITGLAVNSSINSSDPITVFINGSVQSSGQISNSSSIHSCSLNAYYDNPAFTINYTIQAPANFTFVDATDEYITVSGLNSSTVTVNPAGDPNENDSTFTEDVSLLATSASGELFAEIYPAYYDETSFDADGDSDYDYLITKFKFNTTENGTFKITGTLKGPSGTILAEDDHKGYYLSGTKLVELFFDGKEINKKQKNGQYRIIVNLYYEQNDTFIWIDSLNKTTNSYNFTDFTSPPLYFAGGISDTTIDDDEDGLYDSLIISVDVYVGDPDNYEMEADIGVADFNYHGDPFIAHLRKDVTFMDTGAQIYNFTFDGSLIYQKGRNASIWVNVRARSYTEGDLDEIFTLTDQYYYSDFERPLPESCIFRGNVTNVFGQPLEAEVLLRNLRTFSENMTNTDENGSFFINLQPGDYEANVWCTNGSNYEGHQEYIEIGNEDENETMERQIMLLPYWHECSWLDWMIDSWQYASGQPIYLNVTSSEMPHSNTTLEIYREFEQDDGFRIQKFITAYSNSTDENGIYMYVINTSSFSNGKYMLQILVYNETMQTVARGDAWDIQLSSISLDFDINRQNYRPGSTGQGTYTLTYINNASEVINSTYTWSIMYWDWMGEHIIDSGEFTNNESGNGTFDFSIPSDILEHGDWFDLRFAATDSEGNSVQAWRGFGITSGTSIDDVTDSPVDGSNGYSGLLLNVTVNVTEGQAGDYRLSASLNSDNWWWITGNETEQSLSEGSNNVQVFLEGDQIQNSGKDGQYRVWVGLYRSGDWNELDHYEYDTDTSYNHNDFCRPSVYFNTTQEITNYTIGPVDNYDALVVNISITSSVVGNYSIHANLHSETEQPGGWMEWHHVAWNRSENIEITSANTTVTIPIRFEGTEIYGSNQNGPWKLNLNLHQITGDGWEEWIAVYDPDIEINYSYDQFAKPSAFVEDITDYGPNADGDLLIGAIVNVSDGSAGTYRINGNLHSSHADGHWWIDDDWNQTTLSNGTNIVNLTFSGSAIYSSGYNGPYNLFIDLEKTGPTMQWLGGNEYDTDSHSYDDFSMPEAVFTGEYTDEGIDDDGDGYYDYLRITVPVEFNETGRYEINGELYQEDENTLNWYWITWGHNEFDIDNASTVNVTIDFSGTEIRKIGRDGIYGVNLWLRDVVGGNELGYLNFDTDHSYNADEFEQSAVRFTEDSPVSDSLSPDNSSINVTLKINSSEVGTYRIHGALNKVIHHPGWDEWIWLTSNEKEIDIVETGEMTVNFSFDTALIQSSGQDGPYMAEFDLMNENWMNVDFLRDYETNAYSLSGFAERPAYFTGDFDDYLYPTVAPEFVKVNVTIQVNQSGNYEIGGDLHKQDGWDWNFIAGSCENRYFSTGLHNVTLQFDAIEILDNIDMMGLDYDTGDTFDLDIWLRRSGEWLELDHLSNETKNTYQTSD